MTVRNCSKLYDKPVEGVRMIAPKHPPAKGDVIVGYELLNIDEGCCTKPRPKRLNKLGWISVIAFALVFWPVSCVPCCLACSYDTCQRPVYGTPTAYIVNAKSIEQKDNVLEPASIKQ